MTFLAQPILWASAAVAAPIAIHLLNRMRVKIIHWGAMRFLLESIRKNQRRLRVEDLILLLLRCLLIALLAFAFARPVINPDGTGAASNSGPTIAVLIVDQTASMGQSNGVTTRFEAAKAAAGKILDGLPSNSQAALYFITDRVNQVVPRPTSNLAVVHRILDVAEPGYRSGDLLAGIRQALTTLKPFGESRKEIVIFTDNQLVAWKQLDQIKPLLAEATDVNVQLVPLGGNGEDNLAITALKPEAMVPAAGQIYSCMAEVTNFSAQAVSGVRVTLSLDDQASADEGVIETIPPGKAGVVRLSVKFPQAGFHTLTASIPPDRLPADNQRAMAVQVIDQMQVAIVQGTQPRNKAEGDGYFLSNALVPVPPTNAGEYYLKPELAPASWLEDADFSKEEMIFMTNVSSVSPAVVEKLQKYVTEGGALIIFPGPNTHIDDFNAALKDLLPATLGPTRDLSKTKPIAWQVSNFPHPITSLWNDSNNGSLGTVTTTLYDPLQITQSKNPAEATLPIVNYQDGTPAVVERLLGKGHVVLFSSTANTLWNYLPDHPDFVPFLQRLTGYVSRHESPAKLTLSPGTPFVHPVSSDLVGREYSVVRPDSKGKAVIGGKVELVNREAQVRYRDTDVAGVYRVLINGSDLPISAFAVQMDPAESNLQTAPDEALADLKKGAQTESTQQLATKPAGGVRREFWGMLVLLAAIIAVIEMMLAHKFSLAK